MPRRCMAAVTKASTADIKPNSHIGSGALPQRQPNARTALVHFCGHTHPLSCRGASHHGCFAPTYTLVLDVRRTP